MSNLEPNSLHSCLSTMNKIQIKKHDKLTTEEELLKLSKEQLISRILTLEAHNTQLKNILTKTQGKVASCKQKPFDFSK